MNPRASLFARLLGVGMVAHVVGNWSQPDIPKPVAWVNLLVGLLGIWLSVRPNRRVMMVSAASVVLSVGLEIPITGNHWVVAGLVGAAILVTGTSDQRLAPASRWILLVFYCFAAFAKLNSGFFDPSVSCAVFYGNQWLGGFGLPPIDPSSPLAWAVIWGTVAIECSIPVLLCLRRTRYLGVVVGSTFHTLISFDLTQHFYDFTAVLLALFFLFLPDRSVEAIANVSTRFPVSSRRLLAWCWSIITTGLVILAVLPLTPITAVILFRVPFVLWIPFSMLWLGVLIWAWAPSTAFTWKPGIAGLVVAVAFLNGLTPYTEVKTAYGFNMYANLVTAGGESNHFLVRRTLPLRSGYAQPIEIIRSSDPGLQTYADEGYVIAEPQFRRYLANHPDAAVTFRVAGSVVTLERASQSPVFGDPGPWWWRFFPLRALDTRIPPRCQDAFLPAL